MLGVCVCVPISASLRVPYLPPPPFLLYILYLTQEDSCYRELLLLPPRGQGGGEIFFPEVTKKQDAKFSF